MKTRSTARILPAGYSLIFTLAVCIAFGAFSPAAAGETMFALYENNRREGRGNYITEDFVLLGHSLMLSETLALVEEQELAPRLAQFAGRMGEKLVAAGGDDPVTAASRRYFELLAALVSGAADGAADEIVAGELKLILAAQGIAQSPLMGYKIDYSRFKPRGRYTRNKVMEGWFRAMTWAGSAYFPVLASKATGITAAAADQLTAGALQMAAVINGDEALRAEYAAIDSLLARVFGRVEDLTWEDYIQGAGDAKGKLADRRKQLHGYAGKNGRIARIHDGIVLVDQLEKGVTSGDALCGMRLFPRRYSAESAAFQRLTFPEVGGFQGDAAGSLPFTATVAGNEVVKGFPRALELMWLLGSEQAGQLLENQADTRYDKYEAARQAAHRELGNPPTLAIDTRLMRSWLAFGNQEDKERRLNSMLGYWTWGRYTSLLFTKQSVTGAVKAMAIPVERRAAWLEPAVGLYLWLQADMRELRAALGDRDVIGMVDDYLVVLDRLIAVAERERAGYGLDEGEIVFLNNLDGELARIIGAKDHPIVVDVHTEPNSGLVLQEGLGFASRVVHEYGGEVLRGALFSHFEFKRPMADRLTDEAWQQELTSACTAYFPGSGKLAEMAVYEELCGDPKRTAPVIVSLKWSGQPAGDEAENRAAVHAALDRVLKDAAITGFTPTGKLDNSPVFMGQAAAAGVRALAAIHEVATIEADREMAPSGKMAIEKKDVKLTK